MPQAPSLPAGTVTFLYTDLEGSARQWETQPAAMRAAVARHLALLRRAIQTLGGQVFRTVGDGLCAAFATAPEALVAAVEAQRALQAEPWGEGGPLRARLALHTGAVEVQEGDYVGACLNRLGRLLAATHGRQVVLSQATAQLVHEALPDGVTLRDLGEHRLRDLARPEHVFQVLHPELPADFPPLRSLDRLPNNLPVQATPFIGRERQLAAVCAPLQGGAVRLLTLTGPGGTGKTRLAFQAAAELLDSFADGAFVVSLAPLADPDLVPSAIAQALGLQETGGRSLALSLQDYLREKRLLLVLDNFEHLLPAATVVTALLGAAPGLAVLATSREPLHLYGEQEFPVPPLALPDHRAGPTAAHVAQFEASRLFVERARAARPDFVLTDANAPQVAELCRRLDGLPLALELAAARLRALPLRALLDRLEHCLPLLTGGPRDLPARQQTLRDAIAWSYDLLNPDEQALFRRFAVFRGGTLEAVEAVCAAEAAQPRSTSIALPPLVNDVLDGVTSLVEKSLLKQDETEEGQPWYWMLETVNEFAAERLAESGEAAALLRRHIFHYLRLAESAEPELTGPQQKRWLTRLEREHDNLRAALDWCCALGYAEPAYRLAVAVWWFWQVHGHVREGRDRLTAVLDRFPLPEHADEHRADLRAKTLYAAGVFALIQGDYAAARRVQEEGVASRRALGNPADVAGALQALGTIATVQGDYDAALRVFREAVQLARESGNRFLTGMALHDLANALHEQGDYAAARAAADEAMALLRALGTLPGYRYEPQLATAASMRAIIAQDEGDLDTAQRLMEQAMLAYEEHGDQRALALFLANLGSLATARGEYAAAHERLGASLAIQQDLGDIAGIAFVLDRFAALAAAHGQHARALRLGGAAAAHRTSVGGRLSAAGQARVDGRLAGARRALGDAASAAAFDAGRALPLEAAIAEALAVGRHENGSPAAPAALAKGDARAALSPREREVVTLIARSYTNSQIARELVITPGTVASHVVHILDKLSFSSRIQIATWATAQGLADGLPVAGK